MFRGWDWTGSLAVYLAACSRVCNDETDAGRGRDRPSILFIVSLGLGGNNQGHRWRGAADLVSKAAHASSFGLLDNVKPAQKGLAERDNKKKWNEATDWYLRPVASSTLEKEVRTVCEAEVVELAGVAGSSCREGWLGLAGCGGCSWGGGIML